MSNYAGNNALGGTTPEVGMTVALVNGDGIVSGIIDLINAGSPADDIHIWIHSEGRRRNDLTFVDTAPGNLSAGEWTWPV